MPHAKPLPALLLALLAPFVVAPAMGHGLIVVDRPPPGFRPPAHVPHAFAPLEVRRHQVTVTIDGQVAVTEVEQTFFNPNDQRLEGSYLLPVSRGAKIDSFAMDIDGTLTEAELLDAAKARSIYEDIVRRMKDPALLEYAGQDLFKVRIFPLEPKKEKRVKLKYTQLLRADGGLVEYRCPLDAEKFAARPPDSVSVTVRLDAVGRLTTIHSPSHEVEVKRDGDRKAVVGFETRGVRGSADFRLLVGVEPADDVGLGALVHRAAAEEEGTFALFASPAMVAKPPLPKDIVFVLDTSGSMAEGDKIGQARRALEFCLRNLDARDRFGIVRFATEAEPFAPGLLPADDASREKAIAFVKGFKPIGGTAIADALAAGLKLVTRAPAADAAEPARPCFIVFLTDGLPTVGPTDVEKLVAGVTDAVGKRTIRVFCLGVGTDVNTHLLDRIVHATRAASQYVFPGEDLELKLASFYGKIASPVLTNLELTVEGAVRISKIHPGPLPGHRHSLHVVADPRGRGPPQGGGRGPHAPRVRRRPEKPGRGRADLREGPGGDQRRRRRRRCPGLRRALQGRQGVGPDGCQFAHLQGTGRPRGRRGGRRRPGSRPPADQRHRRPDVLPKRPPVGRCRRAGAARGPPRASPLRLRCLLRPPRPRPGGAALAGPGAERRRAARRHGLRRRGLNILCPGPPQGEVP